MKTIKKSIAIEAPKAKVWDTLLNDQFTRIWYAEFSEGSNAQTDWQVGSKAIFTDNSQCGMVTKVITNQPNEVLSLEYQGVIANGKEEYESEDAKQMKGGRETYRLSDTDGATQLSIESDMGEKYFDSMSEAWERALQKLKSLAEGKLAVTQQNG